MNKRSLSRIVATTSGAVLLLSVLVLLVVSRRSEVPSATNAAVGSVELPLLSDIASLPLPDGTELPTSLVTSAPTGRSNPPSTGEATPAATDQASPEIGAEAEWNARLESHLPPEAVLCSDFGEITTAPPGAAKVAEIEAVISAEGVERYLDGVMAQTWVGTAEGAALARSGRWWRQDGSLLYIEAFDSPAFAEGQWSGLVLREFILPSGHSLWYPVRTQVVRECDA